jgi:hypothetical protein
MNSMVVLLRRRRVGLVLAVAPIAAILLFVGIQTSRATGPLPPVGWSQGANLPAGFDPRWDFAYGYYPPTGEVVLFGGAPRLIGGTWRNDTWIFDGDAWRQGPSAPPGLTPRGGASMAYLPSTQKLVMFGGADGSWPGKNETWLWNGSSWAAGPSAPQAMHGRTGAHMAYFPELGKIVLFAGSDDNITPDLWYFDGTAWTAGSAVPPTVLNRAFAGVAYDASLHKLVIAGGDGTTDVWYFDGTTWTPGPDLPMGARERFRMEYDPQLGGVVMFGGMGPGVGHQDLWLLRAGQWVEVTPWSGYPWPDGQRADGALVWLPSKDALVLFSGIVATAGGEQEGYSDTWFFRDVAPTVASVTLDPAAPNMADAISIVKGATQDGYKSWSFEYAWFKNGVQIPGVIDSKLDPTEGTYVHGDTIVGKVRVTDDIGLAGAWVSSPAVTVVNRAPTIKNVKIVQSKVYTSTTASASGNPSDPDGDTVTQHYTWKVNGVVVANNDMSTLAPANFKAGDSVTVTIQPVDQLGLGGSSKTSTAKVVAWNITAVSATPGQTKTVKAYGFKAGETVDIRLDSQTGPILGSGPADGTGLAAVSSAVPSPLVGGAHMLYGVGRTSGTVGPGPLTATPDGDVSPATVGAGDATVFTGQGFKSGETVSVSFPHGSAFTGVANAAGTVVVNLTASQEPYPGGSVTASAPSGTAVDAFTTKAVLSAPAENKPGDLVPVTVTGFGPNESVKLNLDTTTVATVTTNSVGTWSGTVKMTPYFGDHTLTAIGVTTGASKTLNMDFDPWLTLTPANGPVGTSVQVSSGPGWVPGSTVQLFWRGKLQATVQVGAYGWVIQTLVIPDGSPGSSYTVKLTDTVLVKTATAEFTVTGGLGPNPGGAVGAGRLK